MRFTGSTSTRRGLLAGLVGLVVLLSAACDPGWVGPVAGGGSTGTPGDGGAAVDATFEQPGSIVYEWPTGAYYVVDDAACVIRKITYTGSISTVAGNGGCGYSGDGGAAVDAQIDPRDPLGGSAASTGGLAEDAAGNLYLADSANGRIRKITPDGVISTLSESFDGSGNVVGQVAVTTAGTLYATSGSGAVVHVDGDGTVTSAVDCDCEGDLGDSAAIVGDRAGGLLIADRAGRLVRLSEGSSTPEDVATLPSASWGRALTVDAAGNIFAVGDDSVARIDPDGTVTRIAGDGSPDPGTRVWRGNSLSLALTPMGVAATTHAGLLVSSGRVVYRIDHPASIDGPIAGGCDTTRFHPGADLQGQDLSGVDVTGCDLSGATLSGANLEFADLSGANLTGADLSGADLSGMNLTGAYLDGVDLSGANLSGANLSGLELSGTDLSSATLTGANIDGTYLNGNLTGVISGSLVGTPAALPDGWTLVDGTLVPPDT